jgi:uncharacterized protein DUF742
VTVPRDESWLDGDDGRLVRPYTVSNGRTTPAVSLDLLSMVASTGEAPPSPLEPDHEQALALCREPMSVAEIAARLRLPVVVAKVVVSDLVECGAVTTEPPRPADESTDRVTLERVLNALQRRL